MIVCQKMPRLCRNFNSDDGCQNGECSYGHEPYCTNKRCVKANAETTHTLEKCGQKGGGSHAEYIASKAAKAPVAPPPPPPLRAQVSNEIIAADAYQRGQQNTCGELLFALVSRSHPDRAGKITGMFLAGLNLPELRDLILKPDLLAENITRAIEVLEVSKKEVSETK